VVATRFARKPRVVCILLLYSLSVELLNINHLICRQKIHPCVISVPNSLLDTTSQNITLEKPAFFSSGLLLSAHAVYRIQLNQAFLPRNYQIL
jgi:hypothetical protein